MLPACFAYVSGKHNIRVPLSHCQSNNQIFLNITLECLYNFLKHFLGQAAYTRYLLRLYSNPVFTELCSWISTFEPHKTGCRCIYIYIHTYIYIYGSGGSVGIASGYGLDGPGSNPGEDEIFRPSRLTLGPKAVTAFGLETHPYYLHLSFQPAATREPGGLCGNQRYRCELLTMGIMVPEKMLSLT